ncbi:MAG: metallophosphoesterase family protein [Candidatus Firestonebacteria bacterium]
MQNNAELYYKKTRTKDTLSYPKIIREKLILGVFSDTHNSPGNLKKAAEEAKGFGAEIFIHLGDSYSDAKALFEYSKQVFRVPGLWCKEYSDKKIPNRLILDLNGFKLLLTHSDRTAEQDLPSDKDPQKLLAEEKIDILLYGHSHIYESLIRGDVLHLNPGALKEHDKRAAEPSYGLLTIEGNKANGRVMSLEGRILAETTLLKL